MREPFRVDRIEFFRSRWVVSFRRYRSKSSAAEEIDPDDRDLRFANGFPRLRGVDHGRMWARAPRSTRTRSVSGQQAGRHLGVLTVDGAFSYYTDWERPDPGLAKSGDNNGVNMWCPYDGPGWPAHDPVVNADNLPRIPMYITTATGIPGPYDTLAYPRIGNDVTDFAVQLVLGGGIEAATHHCTTQLAD